MIIWYKSEHIVIIYVIIIHWWRSYSKSTAVWMPFRMKNYEWNIKIIHHPEKGQISIWSWNKENLINVNQWESVRGSQYCKIIYKHNIKIEHHLWTLFSINITDLGLNPYHTKNPWIQKNLSNFNENDKLK